MEKKKKRSLPDSFVFGTKAETIQRLSKRLKKSAVPGSLIFSFEDWIADPAAVLKRIEHGFEGKKIILRSSCRTEDGAEKTQAGANLSLINPNVHNSTKLQRDILQVFESYNELNESSHILIQELISDVEISGVAFTRDLQTGAHYYVINFDADSGRTDTITSGKYTNIRHRTVVISKDRQQHEAKLPPWQSSFINSMQEIEQVTKADNLDIEFAIRKNTEVSLFQVRRIWNVNASKKIHPKRQTTLQSKAKKLFAESQVCPPRLFGDSTCYSNMSDWNPAEIIGCHPSPLAISLYEYLITDGIWAVQRQQYGYKNLGHTKLMHRFCEQPYIDCRASFSSFIPATVPSCSANRIVNAYIKFLKEQPVLHDKIEFHVALTSWTPSFDRLCANVFENTDVTSRDKKYLNDGLREITKAGIERLEADLESLSKLIGNFDKTVGSNLSSIEKAHQLVEECKAYGTLAFAHAARAAFVAVNMLEGLKETGAISETSLSDFYMSIKSVTSEFQEDMADHNISNKDLVEKYGHLRPGTYDIRQESYADNPTFFLKRDIKKSDQKSNTAALPPFEVFSIKEVRSINKALSELDADLSAEKFLDFATRAIKAREHSKFVFTKNISTAFDYLIEAGSSYLGLGRDHLSCLEWGDFEKLIRQELAPQAMKNIAISRMEGFQENHAVKLPSFISNTSEFFVFNEAQSKINFITQQSVLAESIFIGKKDLTSKNLKGKIALIEQADPGFDWLFNFGIVGLVTMYGGANSHMAIRCAELNLPAAIGVGDGLFNCLAESRLFIDCERGVLQIV